MAKIKVRPTGNYTAIAEIPNKGEVTLQVIEITTHNIFIEISDYKLTYSKKRDLLESLSDWLCNYKSNINKTIYFVEHQGTPNVHRSKK